MGEQLQKFHIGLKAIIKSGDEILVMKSTSLGKWEVPGGRIDEAEDEQNVLAREVFEEAGIKLDLTNKELVHISIDTFKDYVENHEGCKLCLVFYKVEVDQKPEVRLSHEHSDYKWLIKDKIESLDMLKESKQAIGRTWNLEASI